MQLNLTGSKAVRHAYRQLTEREQVAMVLVQPMLERNGAYELMVSSTVDPNFGPVLTFGKGGAAVRNLSRPGHRLAPSK